MRKVATLFAAIIGLWAVSTTARAAHIEVDLSSQTMRVSSGSGDYEWPISSARSGYATPRGSYGVQRLEAMHYSHKYYNSPMPHSIFFHGGYAIHGTYETASLGEPASHGCIRISPQNAALLYDIVRSEGARISITGAAPASKSYARAERRHQRYEVAGRRGYQRALGYAAAPRPAPSFETWMRNPGGWSRPGAEDYDPTPDE